MQQSYTPGRRHRLSQVHRFSNHVFFVLRSDHCLEEVYANPRKLFYPPLPYTSAGRWHHVRTRSSKQSTKALPLPLAEHVPSRTYEARLQRHRRNRFCQKHYASEPPLSSRSLTQSYCSTLNHFCPQFVQSFGCTAVISKFDEPGQIRTQIGRTGFYDHGLQPSNLAVMSLHDMSSS